MRKLSMFMAGLLVAAMLPVSAMAAEGGEATTPPDAGGQIEMPAGPGIGEGESPVGPGEPSQVPEPTPVPGTGASPSPDVTPTPAPTPTPDTSPTPSPSPNPDDPDNGDEPSVERPQLVTEEHIVYIRGNGDFVRPADPLSRAEAAQIIYSLLKEPPAGDAGVAFPDVAEDAWYKSVVSSLAEAGLLSGYPDGSFGPDNHISRAEFVTILTRCFEPKEADLPFTDVEGHWAYEQLSTAVGYGWLNGYPDGTVRPDAEISRAEAIAITNRALGRKADSDKASDILLFLDLPYDNWAYLDIMEAALPHNYEKPEGAEKWISCTQPQTQRSPGFYSINGELYCVGEDGYYVRGKGVGVLFFGWDGRYTTGNADLDERLSEVVRQNTVEGESVENNLRRLYNYVMNNYTYRANAMLADGQEHWEADRAAYMIQNGKGNCYDYAALFTMLARKLGYQAIGRSGWIRTDSWSWDEHGWTEITDNGGMVVLCDPEFQGVYVRNQGLNWDLFMKPYGSTPTYYRVAGTVLG